jgi:hypothetical protein
MTGSKLIRILGITALTSLALAGLAEPARAGDADDTIFLDHGGRLRGLVVEEGPASVTIKLADGTIRHLPRRGVKQIVYGQSATPNLPVAVAPPAPVYAPPAPVYYAPPAPVYAPPAPVYAPPAPVYAPPAPGWRFTPEGSGAFAPLAPVRSQRRSKGLMIAGIVLLPLGAATLGLGAAACAVGSQCPNPQLGYADAIMMGMGSVMMVTGIVFTAVGASRRPVAEATRAAPLQLGATVGPRSLALVGLF